MVPPLSHRIAEQIPAAADLYHRLVLVVGPPRSGKTSALRELAADKSWPIVNLNLSLSERLLELTSRQRALRVPRLLDVMAKEHAGEVLILDNIEVLFSRELEQDPLRLLQGLARNRTIVAAWPGKRERDNLTYADPTHPEYKRYQKPEAIIVSTLGVQAVATHAGKKESA